MLEPIINEFAEKICRKRGFKTPYNIVLKAELPKDGKDRERIALITAGNPPTIYIPIVFIRACLVNSKDSNLPLLRDVIERCLEYLPKLHHTLALVPAHEAVALRKDSRNWKKANIPGYGSVIDDRYFKITYSVTVEDTLTHTSITKNGDNIEELVRKAKKDLSRMINENDEMQEVREMLEDIRRAKSEEVKPNEVGISIGEGKVETLMEY